MAMLAVVTLAFVACENSDVPQPGTDQPGPEQPGPDQPGTTTGLTFEVTLGEITSSSVTYSVTPSDLEAEYLCVIYDVESADDFTKDEYLIATLYQELEAEARTTGKTFAEFMPEVVDKGVLTDVKVSRLAPESDYYIIVFGVDPAKNYEATTKALKTKFTTAEAATLATTFEIKTEVDGNSATYTVTPSNNEDIWYFYTLPKATFDAYTDPEGGYRMSQKEFMLFCLERDIENWRSAGYSDNAIMNNIFHKGEVTLEAKDLIANAEYINMVSGFFVTEDGQVTIATEPYTTTYTTGDVKSKNISFEISVTDIEAIKAAIKVTPSNNKDTFCWMCGAWDGEQSAEDIMNGIVAQYGGWMNSGMMLYTGVQDFTGGPGSMYKYSLPSPDTEYYVIAFGYAGGITSEPKMVTFRSAKAGDPEDTTFTMTVSNTTITPYSADIELKTSDTSTFYVVDVCNPADFDEETIIKVLDEGFDETLAMYREMDDPNTTPLDILSLLYYRGNQSINGSGFTPNTTLMGFVAALSFETGHVVKLHKFENLFTTTEVGSITPTVEIVGHYSGDEENGSIFGQPAATKGKAISVVKYSGFDGARSLFTTMVLDDVTNLNEYPDPTLWREATGLWKGTKLSQPYNFYIAEWDTVQTGLAYAIDNNGLIGGIGRVYSCATAETKGDINELKALVDELNAESDKSSKSFYMPESVVIGKNTGITLTFESAEVEMPTFEAKAEPKSVEVEAFTPSYNATYIRPFYM